MARPRIAAQGCAAAPLHTACNHEASQPCDMDSARRPAHGKDTGCLQVHHNGSQWFTCELAQVWATETPGGSTQC